MTTNLEWLCENDRDMLLTMMTGECGRCKFDDECEESLEPKCSRGDWLNAEYVEPDSWKKIEKDASLDMIGYCRTILKWNEAKIWSSTYKQIHNTVVKDIVDRCKKLAGVDTNNINKTSIDEINSLFF